MNLTGYRNVPGYLTVQTLHGTIFTDWYLFQAVDKEENKTIALGTSKLNYLDPRISVAWCKKFDVPIEKVYNKTQREKFRWAIDMAGPDYEF